MIPEYELKSIALEKAVELVTSRIMKSNSSIQIFETKEIIDLADEIYNWLIKSN